MEWLRKSEQEIKKIDCKLLLDSGLLFKINRDVLHPLGMALEIGDDTPDNTWIQAKLWDYRDDPEGVLFEEETYIQAKAKLNKFMKEFGDNKLKEREATLGYRIQGLEAAKIYKRDEGTKED